MAIFDNRAGNQTFRGTEGEEDQLNLDGALTDYVFRQNANGTVNVFLGDTSIDQLISIEGLWFNGEQAWYSLEDALRLTTDRPFIDANGVLTGTLGRDVLIGTDGVRDVFYGNLGNDRIAGAGDEYDQVEYDGELIEYTFIEHASGALIVRHPTWGQDILTDIDGFWFIREGAWYSVEDALALTADLPKFRLDADDVLNGTPFRDVMRADEDGTNFYGGTGDDVYRGRNNAYDQVNYDGDFSEYTVTSNANGSVTLSHDIWGSDTLYDIDGLFFNGPNGGWMSVEQAQGSSLTAVSPIDYDLDAAILETAEMDFDLHIDLYL